MKWNGVPNSCETFSYGEVEDYTINISPPPDPPVADFSANQTSISEGETINFSDLSTNTPTSWSWTFPGGTPASSAVQNPSVVYNTAGTYNVELTATNAGGGDTETKTSYITVDYLNLVLYSDTIHDGESECFDAPDTITVAGSRSTFIVEEGGDLTLVAGEAVFILPGFLADSGSHFQVKISDEGCTIPANPVSIVSVEDLTGGLEDELDHTVGLDDNIHEQFLLSVYPNPTTGKLTINIRNWQSENIYHLFVIDFLGNVLINADNLNTNTSEIDISNYPKGMYLIRVIQSKHSESVKIIKY